MKKGRILHYLSNKDESFFWDVVKMYMLLEKFRGLRAVVLVLLLKERMSTVQIFNEAFRV